MNAKWIIIGILSILHLTASATGIDCYQTARRVVGQNRALDLCAGAVDTSPSDCLRSARGIHLTEIQSAELCASATSAEGPVNCYTRAYQLHLGQNRAIELCRFSGNGFAVACFVEVRSKLTENEAIELCIQSPSAETVQCFDEARGAHLSQNQAIQLCQSRRFK